MCGLCWRNNIVYGATSILKTRNTRKRGGKAGSDSQFCNSHEVHDFHARCQRTTPARMHRLQKEKPAAVVLEKITRVRSRGRGRKELRAQSQSRSKSKSKRQSQSQSGRCKKNSSFRLQPKGSRGEQKSERKSRSASSIARSNAGWNAAVC